VLCRAAHVRVQGRGLGRFLMQLLELVGRRSGVARLMLTVFHENAAAVQLYRKLGWAAACSLQLAASRGADCALGGRRRESAAGAGLGHTVAGCATAAAHRSFLFLPAAFAPSLLAVTYWMRTALVRWIRRAATSEGQCTLPPAAVCAAPLLLRMPCLPAQPCLSEKSLPRCRYEIMTKWLKQPAGAQAAG
jgi:hypothetical protein